MEGERTLGFIWNKERECMPRKDLEELQLARLKAQVKRAYEKVPFYREKLEKAGIYPEKIKTLKDVRYLPVTTKDDLRDNYPLACLPSPKKNWCGFMLPAAPPGGRRWWAIPGGIWKSGLRWWPGL
jgi:phenylacetate-coenzyme A ligase PaaK-like adenylate-forming protein